jgi:hypothetical protein
MARLGAPTAPVAIAGAAVAASPAARLATRVGSPDRPIEPARVTCQRPPGTESAALRDAA